MTLGVEKPALNNKSLARVNVEREIASARPCSWYMIASIEMHCRSRSGARGAAECDHARACLARITGIGSGRRAAGRDRRSDHRKRRRCDNPGPRAASHESAAPSRLQRARERAWPRANSRVGRESTPPRAPVRWASWRANGSGTWAAATAPNRHGQTPPSPASPQSRHALSGKTLKHRFPSAVRPRNLRAEAPKLRPLNPK